MENTLTSYIPTAEFFKEMKKVIENGWTKGDSARDAYGACVEVDDETACKFCLLGAKSKVETSLGNRADVLKIMYLVLRAEYQENYVHEFNDNPDTTKEMVLEYMDKLIEVASSKEQPA